MSSPSKAPVLKGQVRHLPCVNRDLLRMLKTFFSSSYSLPTEGPEMLPPHFPQRSSSELYVVLLSPTLFVRRELPPKTTLQPKWGHLSILTQ